MSQHAEYYPDGGRALTATPTDPYDPPRRSELTTLQATAAVIDALPTENVASPGIWNDEGVLKVGTDT